MMAGPLVRTMAVVMVWCLLGAPAGSQQSRAGSSGVGPARTPWGDPDIQGVFTTDDELGVPFERPPQIGTRAVVTEDEFNARVAQLQRQAAQDAEAFVAERPGGGADGVGPPAHWLERGKPSRRTSMVIDPPDGRIPYLDDEARKRNAVAVSARFTGNKPFDGPQALDWYDRCITRGLPHVILPTIYNNTSEIVQGPGYVAIRYEMIHDARVIPLDGRKPLPSSMRQYFGDSRGRWDGDTLVVEVSNFPAHMVNYRGATAALTLVERFRRTAPDTVHYEVTVADPATFARPWTAALDLKTRTRVSDVFEYACHEGNYAMFNILSGARAAERAK
jgi:hypothetical protein